jgi:2-polyprenyl-6-methoxyphenol hydroxylase-like FAD-dependent oxidoreductase
VGGGPAGAALALRLAQLGRRVAIVEKSAFPRRHVGESLSSGIWPLLEALGMRAAVASAGFLSSSWATVDWAGERRRYQVHGGPGLLVDRARFDALLLEAAASMPGVDLYQPSRVVQATHAGDRWLLTLDTGEALQARYLAEASGRAPRGLSSQRGAQPESPAAAPPPDLSSSARPSRLPARSRRSLGAPTLAMYAYWRGAREGDEGDTLVEAGRGAWYWGAPLPGGEFNATVFVDPGPAADYEGLIRQSRLLAPRLQGARRASEVKICDASPFVDPSPVTSASIKVGDAALSLDPLSSQGVQTAIGTALHAAVVLNTLMDRPDDAELAMEFYRARLAASADFHAAAAADFYRRQASFDEGDFWRRRAPEEAPTATPGPPAPGSRVGLAPELQFVPVAVAEASHVGRRDGVVLGARAYAFLGEGIAVAPLLRALDGPTSAFDVVRRWSRAMPAEQALQVLQWAWSEGLIEPRR